MADNALRRAMFNCARLLNPAISPRKGNCPRTGDLASQAIVSAARVGRYFSNPARFFQRVSAATCLMQLPAWRLGPGQICPSSRSNWQVGQTAQKSVRWYLFLPSNVDHGRTQAAEMKKMDDIWRNLVDQCGKISG